MKINWPETNRRISERRGERFCPFGADCDDPTKERFCEYQGAYHLPCDWHKSKSLAFDLLMSLWASTTHTVLIGPADGEQLDIECEVTPSYESIANGIQGFVAHWGSQPTPAHIAEAWCRVNGVEIAYMERE